MSVRAHLTGGSIHWNPKNTYMRIYIYVYIICVYVIVGSMILWKTQPKVS